MSASAHQLIDEDGHLCNGDSNQKKKLIKETTNHSMFYIA